MPEIAVRKYAVTVEEIFHEGGPAAAVPLKRGAALAVIANPYAGRYVEDIQGFMEDLKPLGLAMAQQHELSLRVVWRGTVGQLVVHGDRRHTATVARRRGPGHRVIVNPPPRTRTFPPPTAWPRCDPSASYARPAPGASAATRWSRRVPFA
mgnify:CR=1 FL=1